MSITKTFLPALLVFGFTAIPSAKAENSKAENSKAENKGQSNLKKEAKRNSALYLRGGKATLASARHAGKRRNLSAVQQVSKAESRFSSTKTQQVKTVKKPLNPYQLAFASLQEKAAITAPALGGRLKVSFIVGKKGEPKQAMIYGIDPSLDKALTAHLSTLRFPKEHAGQFYSSKLTIVAKKVAKKSKKKSKHNRRKRSKK